jgi:hypothetical protein
MSLRPVLILSGGLEILAGVAGAYRGVVAAQNAGGWDRSSPDAALRRGVFSLGLACLKARDDVQSPVGLAVSIGITSYNVLAAVVIFIKRPLRSP